jgi:hypothetical protein
VYALAQVSACSNDGGTGPKKDTIPPKILEVTAPTMYEVVVTFDEKVARSKAEDKSNYSISPAGRSDSLSVLLSILQSDSISVWLETSPQEASSYILTVTNLEDINGNAIGESGSSFEFLGSSVEDTIPPEIVQTYPADQETGLPVDDSVRVVFSERMNTASVESLFSVQRRGLPANIQGDFIWDVTERIFSFTPNTVFRPLTHYDVFVDGRCRDAHGAAMEENHSFSFQTGTEGATATISGGIYKDASTQESGPVHVMSFRTNPFEYSGLGEPDFADEVVVECIGTGPFEYQTGPLLRDSTYYICAYLDLDLDGEPDYVTKGDEYFVMEPFGCFGFEGGGDSVSAVPIHLQSDTSAVDVTLYHPAGSGAPGNCTIMGNIVYEGAEEIDLIYIGISPEIDQSSPEFRYLTALESPGPYTLSSVAGGNYYLYAYAFTDTGRIFSYRDGNENERLDAGDVLILLMGQTLVNIDFTLQSPTPEPGPSSVTGSIRYEGSMDDATVHIGLYENWPLSTPEYTTTIPAPGNFEFLEIQPGSYFAHAFMDVDSDETEGSSDPSGSYDWDGNGTADHFYVPPDSIVEEIDITLEDPSSGNIEIEVSTGTTPIFTWDGDPIYRIRVFEVDAFPPMPLWTTRCEEQIDCIYPPIGFGESPEGTDYWLFIDALDTATVYRVEVERLDPEGFGYRIFSP